VRHFKIPEDAELDSNARRLIKNQPVDKKLCVQFFLNKFRLAVKLQEETGALLCAFFMDDQNIFTHEIHHRDVKALLNQADLILAISPEMAEVYSRKYNREVLFFPPFVTPRSPFVKSRWNLSKSEDIGGISARGQPVAFRQAIEKSLQPELKSPLLANLARHADLWSHNIPSEMIWEALAGNRQNSFIKDRCSRSGICETVEIAS